MDIKYKDFIIRKDQYSYELLKVVEYDKLDKLGGVPTGERGIKEVNIGWYGIHNLDVLIYRILAELQTEDTDLKEYADKFTDLKEELKQFIKNECNSSSR